MKIDSNGDQTRTLAAHAVLTVGLDANGLPVPIKVGADGGAVVAAKTKADSAGYAKALQVKTSAGKLGTLRIHNNGATTVYIQFHNVTSVPADTAVPAAAPIPLAAGSGYESDTPFEFSTGLYICASSTAATKTLIAGNDVWITAEFN